MALLSSGYSWEKERPVAMNMDWQNQVDSRRSVFRRGISSAEFIRAQIPIVQKIICDETWLEGERRHCRVSPEDRVVQRNVAQVILREGDKIMQETLQKLKRETA